MKVPRLLLLCLVLAGCTPITGCVTGPAVTREAALFYTFHDTWTLAHVSYQGFCERVVQGKVARADELKVDAAWNRFRAAFKASFRVANMDWNAASTEQVDTLRDEILDLIRRTP